MENPILESQGASYWERHGIPLDDSLNCDRISSPTGVTMYLNVRGRGFWGGRWRVNVGTPHVAYPYWEAPFSGLEAEESYASLDRPTVQHIVTGFRILFGGRKCVE